LEQDHRTYTDAEKQQLTSRLLEATTDIHGGAYAEHGIDTKLLCELHARMFADVRFHAGTCRGPTGSSEYLEFGPNRSTHRSKVKDELCQIFEQARRFIRSCDENPDDPNYERGAFRIAVWVHARVVQIHPFEDGNGRTSRLLLDAILVRLGLPTVVPEFPKQEYNEALNRF
jgi:fido (protein-threonine AMPylation protein)